MAEESRKATIVAWACAALVVVAVLVFVVDLFVGPLFSLSTTTWAPEFRDDRMIGGIEGPVKAADVSTDTMRVASGFLGLASLPVVITPQTQITIKGKLGGFADLDRGQLVRVAYEVLPDHRLLAWRVDVLDRGSSETVVPAKPEGDPVIEQRSPGEKRAPQPVTGTVSAPPPRAQAPSSPSASPHQNAAGVLPSKPPVVPPSSSPRTQVQDSPRSVPAPRPPAPATVTPGARQAEDGSDAIDWLLKEFASRGQ
jgi:hypothetical protein